MSLQDFKDDAGFMQKLKDYNKAKWHSIKLGAKLQLSEIPIIVFIMLTSVVLSMLAIASLFFAIFGALTPTELTTVITELISKPNTILWLLALLCMIPIIVFSMVVWLIAFTCDYYYNKKELEKELKGNE